MRRCTREVLDERPDALAERTYAVWPDLAGLMREAGVGQFTVDSHRAVAAELRTGPARWLRSTTASTWSG